MRRCVFTICAKNYIGVSMILRDSILSKTSNLDFYIVVSDEPSPGMVVLEKVLFAKDIALDLTIQELYSASFKYSLVEFCTFLKPYCFKYFLSHAYDEICYFDPDIYFFSSAEAIFDQLAATQILVTPHLLDIEVGNKQVSAKVTIEDELRGSGIFNFGFVGIRRGEASLRFINWWMTRLYDKCYCDSVNYLFTDQKWGDYLPGYFGSNDLAISRSYGWNIAPWNLSERQIFESNSKLFVRSRASQDSYGEEVIFVHFSGLDYSEVLRSGVAIEKNGNHRITNEDSDLLIGYYCDVVKKNADTVRYYLKYTYTYDFYSDGHTRIDPAHRRLFRGFMIAGVDVGDPFSIRNPQFFKRIKRLKMFRERGSGVNDAYGTANTKILSFANKVMRVLYKLLGFQRYSDLLSFFKVYSQYENQVHLVDNKINQFWYREPIF